MGGINTIVEKPWFGRFCTKLKAAKAQGIVEYPLNKIVLLMRIVKLTPRTERWLLARRAQRDDEAHSVAGYQLSPMCANEATPALFSWTKELDELDLSRTGVWISEKEIRAARAHVSSGIP